MGSNKISFDGVNFYATAANGVKKKLGDPSSLQLVSNTITHSNNITSYIPNFSGKIIALVIGNSWGNGLYYSNLSITGINNAIIIPTEYSSDAGGLWGALIKNLIVLGDAVYGQPIAASGIANDNNYIERYTLNLQVYQIN